MILLRALQAPAFKHLRQIDLGFPQSGSILIEGPNESGKSTLFEAVYYALYGAPLVADDGTDALAGLIPHDGQTAAVTLSLLANTTELEVSRSVTRQPGAMPRQEARLVV